MWLFGGLGGGVDGWRVKGSEEFEGRWEMEGGELGG